MAAARSHYLKKFNALLNKLSTPLNIINIVVGLLLGIAHVYIPLPSIAGLFLGIAMACSSSASMGISYYFTSVNTRSRPSEPMQEEEEPAEPQATRKSNIFLVLALPMILLNSAGSFFGMYTGIPLLAVALGTPVGPALLAVIVVLASVLAFGTLINSWLQVHHLAEKLKTPPAPAPVSEEDSPMKQEILYNPLQFEDSYTPPQAYSPNPRSPGVRSGSLWRGSSFFGQDNGYPRARDFAETVRLPEGADDLPRPGLSRSRSAHF